MITWNIQQMQRKETDGFVIHVWYLVSDIDGIYSSVATGECDYTQSGDTFIPYEDLTQDMVIGWVKESLGAENVAALEANLDAQIAAKKAVIDGVPWNTLPPYNNPQESK
jgi:hypothetical protein